ncbi:hypothetical protein GCM10007932_28510 [Vibrio penaeicida]|uniref:Uncharacterized protein n=1 Tax=Vibrio penaeicida TaxID=104609 RepID=A0AAV5NS40_9VIBR|nr:hypothetical protein GCM10007932_28510 [Vibrio penaeicida]
MSVRLLAQKWIICFSFEKREIKKEKVFDTDNYLARMTASSQGSLATYEESSLTI